MVLRQQEVAAITNRSKRPRPGAARRGARGSGALLWWFLALVFLGLVIAAACRPEFGSEATKGLIRRLFPALDPGTAEAAAYWLRRAVHFLAYLALAVILVNALAPRARRSRLATASAAIAIALAVAVFDETLQARFPARMGRARDVALDLAGIAAGTVLRLKTSRKRSP